MPEIPPHLQLVRGALRKINASMSRERERKLAPAPPRSQPSPRVQEAEALLRLLEVSGNQARDYFRKHLPRLARTLALVPDSAHGGAILELGCYLQITPFLQGFCGYSSVRGAHFGQPVGTETKVARVDGRRIEIPVDLFDAEQDPFPYEDGVFATVLACELIEHLLFDPMRMLLECRRVLKEAGRLVLTTPNVASLTSVARVLHGYDNPQIYSQYSIPKPGFEEIPHVREYTAFELRDTVEAAGFEIQSLFTEPIDELSVNLPMWNFLEEQGYNTSLRGEQTYCVAVKRAALPVNRYPKFLYCE